MNTRSIFVVLCLLISLHTSAFAIDPHETLRWKLEMAESSYRVNKSIENKSNVLDALEQFTQAVCMGTLLKTLKYSGADSEQCRSHIDSLLELDPENPIAICARDGIDSVTCAEKYSAQRVYGRPLSADSQEEFNQILAKQREPFTAPPMRSLKLEYKSNKSYASYKALVNGYRTLLRHYCRGTEVELVNKMLLPEDSQTLDEGIFGPSIFGPGKEAATPDPLDALEQLGKSVDDEEPAPEQLYVRVRYIPVECDDTLKDIEANLPLHYLGPCYRHGFYSPGCISSMRRDRVEIKRLKELDAAASAATQAQQTGPSGSIPPPKPTPKPNRKAPGFSTF